MQVSFSFRNFILLCYFYQDNKGRLFLQSFVFMSLGSDVVLKRKLCRTRVLQRRKMAEVLCSQFVLRFVLMQNMEGIRAEYRVN